MINHSRNNGNQNHSAHVNSIRQENETLQPDTLIIEDELLRKGFTSTPNYILDDTTVSIAARFTYITLLSFAWQEGSCYPGQTRLAKKLGVTDRAVRKYLSELIERGYIKVSRRGLGKTNVYRILKVEGVKSKADRNARSGQERNEPADPKRNALSYKEYPVEENTVKEYSDISNSRMLNISKRSQVRGNRGEAHSNVISQVVRNLTNQVLNDPDHVASNITRAHNSYRRSGVSESEFVLLIAQARKITFKHYGSIRKDAGYLGLKNQAPYFFKVLENLLRDKNMANLRKSLIAHKGFT